MRRLPPIVVRRVLTAALCLPSVFAAAFVAAQTSPGKMARQVSGRQVALQRIKVLGGKDAVEIEVEASDRIVPQTQLLTGPDRLVVDFPNAVPGSGLRNQSVEQGEVKDVRFGLFQNKPPVTRLVFDLKSAQAYQVFPGRTVIIKVSGGGTGTQAGFAPGTGPGLVAASYTTGAEPIRGETAVPARIQAPVVPPVKPLEVWFRDGLLTIHSDKATLSEVLFAVQQRTGAEIGIVAGAEQEKVVVNLGPAPAPEVLAQLLNGSRFNFLIVSAANNPRQLERVIMTPRPEGMVVSRAPTPAPEPTTVAEDDDEPARPAPPPPVKARPQTQPGADQREVHPPELEPGSDPQ